MGKVFSLGKFLFIFLNLLFLVISFYPKQNKNNFMVSPLVNRQILASEITEIPQVPQNDYHILLLGLDGRKGDRKQRCDAVHIFSFYPDKENLVITSIPRGTLIESSFASPSASYLANSCSYLGVDHTIPAIEKLAGINIDAVVKVGFSEVIGILRNLKLPTTPTLMFLRSRKYAIGDNQRNYNQATFFKDMITAHFEEFIKLPRSVKYLIYKTVDTDLDFELADQLLTSFYKKGIHKFPEKIVLLTKPNRNSYVKEIHFNNENFTNGNLQNDNEFLAFQNQLGNYLHNLSASRNYQTLITPFQQKIWLQLEDKNKRQEFQFKITQNLILASRDSSEKKEIIEEYKTELQLLQEYDYLMQLEELETELGLS